MFKLFKLFRNNKNVSIDDVGFSLRTYNCLKRVNVSTLGDIANLTRTELLKIRNLGKTNVQEIEQALKKHHLKLAGK